MVLEFAVGVVILVAIVAVFGVNGYITAFRSVNLFWFLMSCVPAFLIRAITAFQVYYICAKTDVDLSFKDSLFISNWGSIIGFFSTATDLLYTMEATKNYGHTDRSTTLNRLGFMYSVGTIVTVFGVYLGLMYVGTKVDSILLYPLTVLAYVMLLCAILFIIFTIGPSQVGGLKHRILEKMPSFFSKILSDDLNNFKKGALVLLTSSTLNWLIKTVEWIFLGLALNISLPFLFCFSIFFLVDLARQVPFIPTSIGLLDIVTAVGLATAGMTIPVGLAFAMLNRCNNLIANGFAFFQPKYVASIIDHIGD